MKKYEYMRKGAIKILRLREHIISTKIYILCTFEGRGVLKIWVFSNLIARLIAKKMPMGRVSTFRYLSHKWCLGSLGRTLLNISLYSVDIYQGYDAYLTVHKENKYT